MELQSPPPEKNIWSNWWGNGFFLLIFEQLKYKITIGEKKLDLTARSIFAVFVLNAHWIY